MKKLIYCKSKLGPGLCARANARSTSTPFEGVFSRLLFDTGDGQQPEYFLNLKKSLNFDRISIKGIILSHWHHDHVGGVGEVLNAAEVSSKLRALKCFNSHSADVLMYPFKCRGVV